MKNLTGISRVENVQILLYGQRYCQKRAEYAYKKESFKRYLNEVENSLKVDGRKDGHFNKKTEIMPSKTSGQLV